MDKSYEEMLKKRYAESSPEWKEITEGIIAICKNKMAEDSGFLSSDKAMIRRKALHEKISQALDSMKKDEIRLFRNLDRDL